MKSFKKLLALALCVLMVMAILAGCGPKKAEKADEPLGENLTKEEKFAEHVTLTWCFPDPRGAADFSEWDRIVEAINEITMREINATINIEVIPLGEYTEKMSLKYGANERWDVCFSGSQWNSFASAVSNGAFEPLSEEYTKTYLAETMATLKPEYLKAVTIDGKVYGVPLQQIYVRQNGIKFEIDWADELGFDYNQVTKFEDLEPYFDTLLANGYTECFMGAGEGMMENISSWMGFDNLISTIFPGAIRVTDGTCKVFNQYESEEFKYIADLMARWYQTGYFTDGVAFGGQDNPFDEDRHPVSLEPVVKPGGDALATMKMTNGTTIKTIPIGSAVLTTSSIAQTVMAVSQNCPYPGRALAFINLLNTNEELLNLICFGEEGIDWEWIDKENKLIEPAFGAYPGNEPFLVGNTFLSYHVDESQIGCWEETKAINDSASASPLLGFTFDSRPIRSQMSTISGNIDEYLEPILCGMGEPSTEAAIASLNQFLYDAGLQEILDEMQRQVDEWLANQ